MRESTCSSWLLSFWGGGELGGYGGMFRLPRVGGLCFARLRSQFIVFVWIVHVALFVAMIAAGNIPLIVED
jgi:hypothetical protein